MPNPKNNGKGILITFVVLADTITPKTVIESLEYSIPTIKDLGHATGDPDLLLASVLLSNIKALL